MEHLRTTNFAGGVYQWADEESAMILDAVTGEPIRFGPHMHAIGSLRAALQFVAEHRKGCEDRTVIVRMQTIEAVKLSATPNTGKQ